MILNGPTMKKYLSSLIMLSICLFMTLGCGRKGQLEPPTSTLVQNSSGKMVEKPKPDKPFILDRLIK